MVLNVHSDASYLSETRAQSRVGGYYLLGSNPKENEPIQLNGNVYTLSTILKFVVASAAEAELGALFHNAKEAKVLRLALQELGHPQPPTPIHCDNKTAVGIANKTIKKQRSTSMDMIYFLIADQVCRKIYDVKWHPGQEILQTTSQNPLSRGITLQSDHGTYTWKTQHDSYREQTQQVM